MNVSKMKVIKDFEKLGGELQELLKLQYPKGFKKYLIKFKNKDGVFVSALPFETDDRIYMVRMTVEKAQKIIQNDSDYDDGGKLKTNVRKKYEAEYSDLEHLWDNDSEDELGFL